MGNRNGLITIFNIEFVKVDSFERLGVEKQQTGQYVRPALRETRFAPAFAAAFSKVDSKVAAVATA